jgi:gliding motility-associated-like protein
MNSVSIKYWLLSLCLVAVAIGDLNCQVVIDNSVDAAAGVQNVLVGNGVTASNITFQGNNAQVGSFTCSGSCNLGISNGLVLGSGNVDQVPGNDSNSSTLTPASGSSVNDNDLDLIVGSVGFNDAAIIEFDFVPTGDSLMFNFVFGSEEYPEFVFAGYNDGFGFFLSGPGISGPYSNNAENIALIPGTGTPVTIDNVNASTNAGYFIDNFNNSDPNTIECNGFTTVLTAFSQVQCGETYHIKLAIGDAGDDQYDSFVFLQANSFQSNEVHLDLVTPSIGPVGGIYEGCLNAELIFSRPEGQNNPITYDLEYTGTATNSVDVTQLPSSVSFAAMESTVSFDVFAIQDNLTEVAENLIVTALGIPGCNGTQSIDVTLIIEDIPVLEVAEPSVLINCGQEAVLTPTISGGLGEYTVEWNGGITNNSITVSPLVPTTYSFTVSDICGVASVDGIATVDFIDNPPLSVEIGADQSLSCLDAIESVADVNGGFGTYTYNWEFEGNFISSDQVLNYVNPNGDGQVTILVTDECGITAEDAFNVVYPAVDVNLDLGDDYAVTCIEQTTLIPVVDGGVGSYTYSWSLQGGGSLGALSTLDFQTSSNATVILQVTDQCGNSSTDQVQFTMQQASVNSDIGSDLTVTCIDINTVDATINGAIGTVTYQWLFEGTAVGNTQSIDFQAPDNGTLQLTATDECGNVTVSQIDVVIPPVPITVDAGDDQVATCLDVNDLSALVAGGVGNYTYSWTSVNGQFSSNQNSSIQVQEDSQINVLVTDQCGNTASDVLQITIPPVPVLVDAGNDQIATCLDINDVVSTVSGGVGSYTYVWSDGNGAIWVDPAFNVQLQSTTTFTITIVDQCGNTATDMMIINIPPVPVEVLADADTTLCIGDSLRLDALATGGVGNITYRWEPNQVVGTTYVTYPEASATYTVTARDECGNFDDESVFVEVVNVQPGFTFEYIGDFGVQLTNQSLQADSYEWTFPDSTMSTETDPLHYFTDYKPWEVTITAIANDGCRRSYTEILFPEADIYVPNCITPDGDGINDMFFARGHDLKSYKIQIFDRWGNELYSSHDIDHPWDGSYENTNYYVTDGSFTYQILAEGIRGNLIEKTGFVIIIR